MAKFNITWAVFPAREHAMGTTNEGQGEQVKHIEASTREEAVEDFYSTSPQGAQIIHIYESEE